MSPSMSLTLALHDFSSLLGSDKTWRERLGRRCPQPLVPHHASTFGKREGIENTNILFDRVTISVSVSSVLHYHMLDAKQVEVEHLFRPEPIPTKTINPLEILDMTLLSTRRR